MNVALWAEIRRLAEIEKLSGWAISRRLRCSRHTVAAALALDQPPARQASHRASVPGTKTCTEFEFPEGLFYGRKLAEYSAGFRAKNTRLCLLRRPRWGV